MKLQPRLRLSFTLLILMFAWVMLQAQPVSVSFKEPIVKIDFGSGGKASAINVFPLRNYTEVESMCPADGNYSFVSHTSECFNNDWFTFTEDHTPGDYNGKMMLVNASPEAGIFFNTILTGFNGNTTYELSAWMINVCRILGGCDPLPPNITIKLLTTSGVKIASFRTGLLSQYSNPHWKVYSGLFTTPADVSTLILTMEDVTIGGCGNDFALDDLVIREVVKTTPVIKPSVKAPLQQIGKPTIITKEPEEKKGTAVAKSAIKKVPSIPLAVRDTPVTTIKDPVINAREVPAPTLKKKLSILPVPQQILTRENPLIKQIEAEAGEIEISLYDNGEIDGDTVSIYHNNKLVVSEARLSFRPVAFKIKVDRDSPSHELIMVANNLGSIPPNTSTMVISTGNRRYEVFISSSEQKNAKIIIRLKE